MAKRRGGRVPGMVRRDSEPVKIGPVTASLLRWRRRMFVETFGREPAADEPVFFDVRDREKPVELKQHALAAILAAWFAGEYPGDPDSRDLGLTAENAKIAASDLASGMAVDEMFMRAFGRAGRRVVP